MQLDKRKHPRYAAPEALNALITISPPLPDKSILLEGTVLDMSQRGIKIKLSSPVPVNIPESKILIDIVMPRSGLPVKIRGQIRHINDESECGINYLNEHSDDELDNLLFECIKLN